METKDFSFKTLTFSFAPNGKVYLKSGLTVNDPQCPDKFKHLGEVQIAGRNHSWDGAQKQIGLSELETLQYIGHKVEGNVLTVVQENERIRHETVFEAFDNCNAYRIFSRVTNVSKEEQIITAVSAFTLFGFSNIDLDPKKDLFFHEFLSAQHSEVRAARKSFLDCGLANIFSSYRFANIGSFSSKERYPQGILEDAKNGVFLMFQIESNGNWYYELDRSFLYVLNLYGNTERYHGWAKRLLPGDAYETPRVSLATGNTHAEVLAEMTRYRRIQRGDFPNDERQEVIFNEYMHLRWDSPEEAKTKETVPLVAQTGTKYYVIDCGWHDEVPASVIYRYVGIWKQSKTRFPNGLAAMGEYIRANGMKMGLWIEPEVVGMECREMLDFYPDECFLQRYGKKVCEQGRYFLDFRHPLVRKTLSEAVDRMVNEYGAEYIKMDYNQDCGPGTDLGGIPAALGLEEHNAAYLSWAEEQVKKYPHVLFESCSSGGQRADQKTLSRFPLMSTSDQIYCEVYPYIINNVFTAVLPEQAGIWCYPADVFYPKDQVIGRERVVLNAVNAVLGRIHLASDLFRLNEEGMAVLKEGIRYSLSLAPFRKVATPVLPTGYATFGDPYASVGLKADHRLVLAVWCLSDERTIRIDLTEHRPSSVRVSYPQNGTVACKLESGILTVTFPKDASARVFELDLQ